MNDTELYLREKYSMYDFMPSEFVREELGINDGEVIGLKTFKVGGFKCYDFTEVVDKVEELNNG